MMGVAAPSLPEQPPTPLHADLMRIVGGDGIETLITQETLARMSLSAVKQPGIAVAYENILGFGEI